ncbi:MAG: type II toxin-antitoxin system HicB family antitoxin [Thermoflexales bacterium]
MADQTIYKLPLVFEPQPEGGYTVACPILPKLITEGDTIAEALENVKDALLAVVETYQDLHRPLPAALKQIALDRSAPFWMEATVAV